MKVRCVKLIDSRGDPQERSSWLTLGKVYHVLELVTDMHGKWRFRLVGDGPNGTALFDREQFEVVSARLPDTWIAHWSDNGGCSLTTEVWAAADYWEKFYDGDPAARSVFEEEERKILNADR